ncbi:unnamed protein product, partial [Prunus brigantina]
MLDLGASINLMPYSVFLTFCFLESAKRLWGVEEFLRIALANAVDQGRIRCPCQKCGNTRKFTIRVIREHMYFNGFDQTYKDWIWHGKDIEINARYYACPICGDKTYAERLEHGNKMAFTGHRKFLSRYHPYRKLTEEFNGKEELDLPPMPLTREQVWKEVESINYEWGKRTGKRKDVGCTNCYKKKSIFFNLPYWKSHYVRHCLDVMHIEKNVCESIFGTLLNIPGKTKDGVAAREDLVKLGVRIGLAPQVGEKRTFLPP